MPGCISVISQENGNPNMAPYIYMERNGIHVINLYKTAAKLQEANEALKKIAASGRKILLSLPRNRPRTLWPIKFLKLTCLTSLKGGQEVC